MDQTENDKNKRLFEKCRKDPSKKLLRKHRSEGDTSYEFHDWSKDMPDERRVATIFFRVYDNGAIYMRRYVQKSQKFLCVGGPLAGQKSTDDDAPEYVVFNCANSDRSRRDKSLPRVILVHRGAWAAAGKSRKRTAAP